MPDDIFPALATVTDVGVRDMEITLFRPNTGQMSARYNVQVARSDGSTAVRSGDLVPNLTTAEINGLMALMNRLNTKAKTAWGNG